MIDNIHLQIDLNNIEKWAIANNLSFNPKKCKSMLFSCISNIENYVFRIYNSDISNVNNYQDL